MAVKNALVRFERTAEGDWKGYVVYGDGLPRKFVFIDGAKRGRPAGVTPDEGVLFLTEIVGETNHGERKGVLFGKPIRPAQFDWAPVPRQAPVFGVRRVHWTCTDMPDMYVRPGSAPFPEQEHPENIRYEAALDLQRRFTNGALPAVFLLFGWPDAVSGQERHRSVELRWDGVGTRQVSAADLITGWPWNRKDRPPGVHSRDWRDLCAPWPVEFVPGSVLFQETWDGDDAVAGFRLRAFPEVVLSVMVASFRKSGMTLSGTASLLPEAERVRILERARARIPDPVALAQSEIAQCAERAWRTADYLARLEVSGEMRLVSRWTTWTTSWGESEDEMRPAGSEDHQGNRSFAEWHVPGDDTEAALSVMLGRSDAGAASPEQWLESQRERQREQLSRELSYLAYCQPPASMTAGLSDEERAQWLASYEAASRSAAESARTSVRAHLAARIAQRQRLMDAWPAARAERGAAWAALHDLENRWRRTQRELGLDNLPRCDVRGDESLPEAMVALAQQVHQWIADRENELSAAAAAKQLVLESGPSSTPAPRAPWYLCHVKPETVQETIGREPGEGIGQRVVNSSTYVPGDSSLVAFSVHRGGGKRHHVEVASSRGVEILSDSFDGRCGMGTRTVIARIMDSRDWEIRLRRTHDGEEVSGDVAHPSGLTHWDQETPWEVIGTATEPMAEPPATDPNIPNEEVPQQATTLPAVFKDEGKRWFRCGACNVGTVRLTPTDYDVHTKGVAQSLTCPTCSAVGTSR